MSKKIYLLALPAMAALPLLVKLPAFSPTWLALNDSAHAVLFLLLSVGLAVFFQLPSCNARVDRRWQYLWLGLLGLGVAIEVVQSFIGRSASFYDVFLDVIGIVVGSLLYCAWGQKRWFLAGLACLFMAFAFINPLWVTYHSYLLKKQRPIICNFDGPCPWALGFNQGVFKTIKPHMPENTKWPNNRSEFGVLTFPIAAYPGAGVLNAFISWEGYGELCAEIYWPYLWDTRLGVHIHDAGFPHKSQKFDRVVAIAPGSNTVCVSLSDVKETVDLEAAKTLIYYRPKPDKAGELYLDNIRLR